MEPGSMFVRMRVRKYVSLFHFADMRPLGEKRSETYFERRLEALLPERESESTFLSFIVQTRWRRRRSALENAPWTASESASA